MKDGLNNNHGVTLLETVISIAIIMIILVALFGALLYGQKMIVYNDSKNNEAAQAQDMIDSIMSQLSEGENPAAITVVAAKKVNDFIDPKTIIQPSDYQKQYIITEKIAEKKDDEGNNQKQYVVYTVWVRLYYNNYESYIELKAYAKKNGVEI
ncbi:hypothetical protein FXB42_03715 [Acetobacterium wieringae]|uniref:Prepilin-type N-terminal cleavage/methylation domain-containing protein n=1 Tax=Acetobacterium wieringae TaxID=52694 RepID=A0A5D0WTF3_9FIRM|nr:prepilin-type N-terminal cleavage/methylation domain-containing protein [Acetobacterium wieringae]TYC87565.1 hypothetical protein FXB42_03715 [Acetobacterium wieringae]